MLGTKSNQIWFLSSECMAHMEDTIKAPWLIKDHWEMCTKKGPQPRLGFLEEEWEYEAWCGQNTNGGQEEWRRQHLE